jgi:hypothetical protein
MTVDYPGTYLASSTSSSESADKERFAGDANTLSCARDMNGVIASGDAVSGGSDLKTRARASGVSAEAALGQHASCYRVGLFERNHRFSVLGPFVRHFRLPDAVAFLPTYHTGAVFVSVAGGHASFSYRASPAWSARQAASLSSSRMLRDTF